jgi:hypothetical protein
MSMIKRRSRTVSFRLSPEEYESLKNVSITSGARSVSEFTRSVACMNSGKGNGEMDSIEETLRLINEKMDILNRELNRLAKAYEENGEAATVIGSADSGNTGHPAPLSTGRNRF